MPNGAGRPTLFALIPKLNVPVEGSLERDPWTMIGYLLRAALKAA